jgi:hypothetical protein
MKVLQTSGQRDVSIDEARSSILIKDRLSPNLPHGSEIPPGLADVIQAWGQLPEAIRAGIVAMVKVARS